MEYTERKTPAAEPPREHRLMLENRNALQLTGVQEVTSYDAYSATLETACGTLVVGGNGIRVQNFSSQTGEASILGEVEYLQYQSRIHKEKGNGVLRRLFG